MVMIDIQIISIYIKVEFSQSLYYLLTVLLYSIALFVSSEKRKINNIMNISKNISKLER